jgi:hypothetical protein
MSLDSIRVARKKGKNRKLGELSSLQSTEYKGKTKFTI